MAPLSATSLPEGFVDVHEVSPSIQVQLAYFGSANFVGRPIDGYSSNRAILSRPAAEALAKVQEALKLMGLGLQIFDAYRPKRAVTHFYRWSQDPKDRQSKVDYYPDFSKKALFEQGYIARQSSHSRGSTVDLTLIDLAKGKPLDMGSAFDFFGPVSWYQSKRITPKQKANRKLLRDQLLKQGFKPYAKEWWHFTLKKEPFPRTYFDFEVR
jgi:D-alanyl-D-alanine dipeptidase